MNNSVDWILTSLSLNNNEKSQTLSYFSALIGPVIVRGGRLVLMANGTEFLSGFTRPRSGKKEGDGKDFWEHIWNIQDEPMECMMPEIQRVTKLLMASGVRTFKWDKEGKLKPLRPPRGTSGEVTVPAGLEEQPGGTIVY